MAGSDARALAERVEKLRELLARDASDATAWFGLGRALLDLGRSDEAIESLRRAIGVDPDYTAAHRDLGRALLESGRAGEASQVLRSALDLAQRTGDLQTGREMEVFLRRARRALGDVQPAVGGASHASSPAPSPAPGPASSEARSAYKRGFEHFVGGRYDQAIALYREALELDPQLSIAWNGLSMAHRHKGELDDAIRAGQRLIELDPNDPLSHTNLSILYMQKGMIPEAEEERAVAMQLQMRARRGG